MDQGQLSFAYRGAIIASIPNLADPYVLNDDSVPVKISLFANDIIPDPSENGGQFEAPDFTGYAPKSFPLVGQDPSIVNEPGTGNTLIKLGPGVLFQPTNNDNLPQTIYGWWIAINSGVTTYLAAGRFAEPVVLTSSLDYIEVEPSIRFMLDGINAPNEGT